MNETTYIGLSQPDGIRYITVMKGGDFDNNGMILKNFYCKESRIRQLLKLGDLFRLGSSPYNPAGPENERNDTVHCMPLGNGQAHEIKDKETFFLLGEWTYLYENGKWMLGHGGNIYDISRASFSVFIPENNRIPPVFDDRIRFATIDNRGKLEFLNGFVNGWDTWKTLQDRVDAKGQTVYVFRETELIRIITPKNRKS